MDSYSVNVYKTESTAVLYAHGKSKFITGFNIYIYIYIYVVHSIGFQTFFVQAFKTVVDSWKFSILLQYILWDDWPIFMISASNEQLQLELEYTLLKPYCHSWLISKMQFGRKDTLEEIYAIKFCFIRKKSGNFFNDLCIYTHIQCDIISDVQHDVSEKLL